MTINNLKPGMWIKFENRIVMFGSDIGGVNHRSGTKHGVLYVLINSINKINDAIYSINIKQVIEKREIKNILGKRISYGATSSGNIKIHVNLTIDEVKNISSTMRTAIRNVFV